MTSIPALSWYGKLPSAGDFLQRRFPAALQRQWSHWFQNGLLAWRQESARASQRRFENAPVWNFAVPPMLGSQMVQLGCLLPGRDSVGRQYPICAQIAFSRSAWSPRLLAQAGDWYRRLGSVLRQAVSNHYSAEQLDRALLTLPALSPGAPSDSEILTVIGYAADGASTLEWPQAGDCFDPERQISYWWTNRCDGYPLYTHVHSGNFTSQLFTLLFDPAGGARPGRHGLYPPMFD